MNSLIRNPVVLPYSHGHKRLDKIYLDTTFASKEITYRDFPSKAAGISELLEKVLQYPKGTVFHFHAWTPGYEEVWLALSSALNSQVRSSSDTHTDCAHRWKRSMSTNTNVVFIDHYLLLAAL